MLKLQHFGHLIRRADSLGKTLILGKIKGRRRRGRQRMRWLDGITDSMDMSLSKLREIVSEGQGSLAGCSPWGHRVRHDWATEQQQRGHSHSTAFIHRYWGWRFQHLLGRRSGSDAPADLPLSCAENPLLIPQQRLACSTLMLCVTFLVSSWEKTFLEHKFLSLSFKKHWSKLRILVKSDENIINQH